MSILINKLIQKMTLTAKFFLRTQVTVSCSFSVYLYRNIFPKMLSTDKDVLYLLELEFALKWLDALKARRRAEKKIDLDANGGNPADMQVSDQLSFRCSAERFMKMKSLVAPTKVEQCRQQFFRRS